VTLNDLEMPFYARICLLRRFDYDLTTLHLAMTITCFIKHPMTTTVFTTCYLLPSLLIMFYEMLVMARY